MKKIRIFISSPGDVHQERQIAYKVITEISKQFSKYVTVEVLMWENFPLTAESTFQEGINYFLNADVIDIAVFILWSRMGTPLCKKFLRPDGTPYQSGTEYEFDLMMDLYKRKGWPRILTYVKQSSQTPNLTNLHELEDFFNQKKKLDNFISEHFRDSETNSNYAYMQFGENASFEHKFREHLRALIKAQIGDIGNLCEWEGNPYVGLSSYEFSQSDIFFGRRQLIYDTASMMVDFQHPQVRQSLIVLGESGSGKSSFVKAGILPFFCGSSMKESSTYEILTPSKYGEGFRQGILDALARQFPTLKGHPVLEEICTGKPQAKDFNYLAYELGKADSHALLLYIDQFEEIFTDLRIGEEERAHILATLRGLVSTRLIHVILSMRNDFYYLFARYEDLGWIKKNSVVVDMPVASGSDIQEIIEEPARKACLKWEVSDKGEGLNHLIANDAVAIHDLPLIEFALSELYEKRDADNTLTFRAYREIGGLEGAIAKYANGFYDKLSPKEQKALKEVLAMLIAKSSTSDNTYVRKTVRIKELEENKVDRQLLDKLIESHLFVSDKNSAGEATVTIAHEVLLRSWSVVTKWIESEKDFLNRNNYYEELARYWIENGRKKEDLIRERTRLYEAEYHHYKYHNRLSAETRAFLEASLRTERRRGLTWRLPLTALAVISTCIAVVIKGCGVEMDKDLAEACGWDNLATTSLWVLLPYMFLAIYAICNRIQGAPLYQTAKRTMWVCGAVLACELAYDLTKGAADWGWMIDLPLIIYFILKVHAWRCRKKWSKLFKPRRLSDLFISRLLNIVMTSLVLVLLAGAMAVYMEALQEKEETMKKRAKYVSLAFRYYDKMKDSDPIVQKYAMDQMWKDFLETSYEDEFKDSAYTNAQLDMAISLYNNNCPQEALGHLFPARDWQHHMFKAITLDLCGREKKAAQYAESYLDDCKEQDRCPYDEVGRFNSYNLIWLTEKAGRFDLTRRLYEEMADTMQNMAEHPAVLLNHGHVPLAGGNLEEAYTYYNRAIETAEKIGVDILVNLRQDMHTFSHFGVIPDHLLRQACEHYSVHFEPAFTSPKEDTELNNQTYEKLAGDWLWQIDENTVLSLNVDKEDQLMRYQTYFNGNLVFSTIAHTRFEKRNGEWLWDEFHMDDDSNSLEKLISIKDDEFVIEIIENGTPNDKGQRRVYRRNEPQ